jgi:hypothetical protein
MFGNARVYNPWDVVNFCRDLLEIGGEAEPRPFWANTSANEPVKRFVRLAYSRTRGELDSLIAGETVEKRVSDAITYGDLESDVDNMYSVLYMTGYLTGAKSGVARSLVIPNREVLGLFEQQVMDWFKAETENDESSSEELLAALLSGDPQGANRVLDRKLKKLISVRDSGEAFYHGLTLALLYRPGWTVESNAEAWEGYADITAERDDGSAGFVIELKVARGNETPERASARALAQIEDKGCGAILAGRKIRDAWAYGIGFKAKACHVAARKACT